MHKYALCFAVLLSLSGIVHATGDKPGAPQSTTTRSPAATMALQAASKLTPAGCMSCWLEHRSIGQARCI
jgi:hypothetical protein